MGIKARLSVSTSIARCLGRKMGGEDSCKNYQCYALFAVTIVQMTTAAVMLFETGGGGGNKNKI